MGTVLKCREISKTYGHGAFAESVLGEVSFSLEQGQSCALIGPSGSGKTTLLSILGCLLKPTSGELWIGQQTVNHGSDKMLWELRRTKIGFVFQHAQLLPFLSMAENVRAVGKNSGMKATDLETRLAELAGCLGIDRLLDKKPEHASGGQRQRVAIARALIHRPAVILADEPTAALDWHNGETVIRLLTEQAKAEKAVLLTVTHDTRLVDYFDRVLHLEDGKLVQT